MRAKSLTRALISVAALLAFAISASFAQAASEKKPNILVIMGDDIGYWNTSAYNRGQMGYRTPNIDRIAQVGAIFTDLYAQQSCTAGRAAFITGQSTFRTGLLKVGPRGAGAKPGPVCYGLGGQEPTVCDADLMLGFLDENYFLGGRMTLAKDAAQRAIEEKIAKPLGVSVSKNSAKKFFAQKKSWTSCNAKLKKLKSSIIPIRKKP